jgi:ribose 5-phosphate isomerase A
MPTIFERAADLVTNGTVIGLGSGRASQAFVRLIGERVRGGTLQVRGVPTSEDTAKLAREVGIPLVTLAEAGELAATFDGADEVDPNLNLIKGWGRALVREKIVAASSKKLVILVGETKLVPKLGSRNKLPVECVPYALPLAESRLRMLGLEPVLDVRDGKPFLTDNGNYILDCKLAPIAEARTLEVALHDIPGVVGSGLFLGMASTVFVGKDDTMEFVRERTRADG